MAPSLQLLSPRFASNGRYGTPVSAPLASAITEIRSLLDDPGRGYRDRVENCPYCGSAGPVVISQKDRYGIPTDTQVCMGCGLVYTGQVLNAAFTDQYYGRHAVTLKLDGKPPQEIFDARIAPDTYTWHRHDFVAKSLGAGFEDVKTVIEIGCADGSNLYPYHVRGLDTVGCDLDRVRVATGRDNGLNLRVGGIDAIEDYIGKADLVILSHVLEHMRAPDETLAEVLTLLAPTGYLYVEVPGISGLICPRRDWETVDGYACSNDLLGYLQFEHNFCFDLTSLRMFAERSGFQLVHGDEVVRAVFSPGNPDTTPPLEASRGTSILAALREAERDYLSENGRLKRFARYLYYRFGYRYLQRA